MTDTRCVFSTASETYHRVMVSQAIEVNSNRHPSEGEIDVSTFSEGPRLPRGLEVY